MEDLEKMQEYYGILMELNEKRTEKARLEAIIKIDEKELVITKAKIYGLNYEITKYRSNDGREQELNSNIFFNPLVKNYVILEALETELNESRLQEEVLEARLETSKKDLAICKIKIKVLEDKCSFFSLQLEPLSLEESKEKQKGLKN